MNPEQKESLTRVAQFVIERLPDSIVARKQLLHDLLAMSPLHTPLRAKVSDLLISLHDHERAQLKFNELLAAGSKPTHDGNGGAK